MDTFITLTVLLIATIWAIVKVYSALAEREKNFSSTLNLPLDNKGKWWYN